MYTERFAERKPGLDKGQGCWPYITLYYLLIFYFPGKLFILSVVHRDQWIIQSYAVSAALILIKTRLSFCKSFHIQRVSGDLHYLLARRPSNILQPFSDKGNSVVLPRVWCHSQKALNKVTFLHSKDTTIYNKERGVQWFITKRKFINSKV